MSCLVLSVSLVSLFSLSAVLLPTLLLILVTWMCASLCPCAGTGQCLCWMFIFHEKSQDRHHVHNCHQLCLLCLYVLSCLVVLSPLPSSSLCFSPSSLACLVSWMLCACSLLCAGTCACLFWLGMHVKVYAFKLRLLHVDEDTCEGAQALRILRANTRFTHTHIHACMHACMHA